MDVAEIPNPGDRYEVSDVLGYGVFGKLYLAADTQAGGKNVAVKKQKYDSETSHYIEEEYNILRDLSSHANLVDFYGIYKKDDDVWFVLELCDGGPATCLVNGLLAKNRRMAEEHIGYILKEVTKAIMYLHENDVIHRDIKCSNILLTREGEVKLCDFGLSQKLQSKEEKLFTRIGSPCWMAPELAAASLKKKDATYDMRVDVWSLGITAIELGEGKAPFQDMHPTRTLFQIVTNPPPALQKLASWSEFYHDFISECLVKCAEYRPCIMEVIEHPFFEQIPENNYHLSLEIKSLLADIDKSNPERRPVEILVNENCLKKGVDGDMEPMYEEDLAALPSTTENNILALLEKRLEMGVCYSFIGDILLYLNPNEKRNIYGKEFHGKYSFKSRSENAPHIYSVADTAYQNALHDVMPQQIVFIGESASGKTSNYLHLLDHLLYLGDNPSISCNRIKNSVKLIHSLIHAATPSNNYSTRAIFKTNISYGKTGKFTAANFKVLGLEKWRVSSADMTQSNFHFLYYVYDGLVAADLAEKYKLNSNRDYRYLKLDETAKSDQPRDEIDKNIDKYKKIVEYLEELLFSEDEMFTIYSVSSAILNLGQLRFFENEDGFAEIENKESVNNVSELLQVENNKMCWALTNYCLVNSGKAIRKKNTYQEAMNSRDVLANTLYARLVDYIVSIVNRNLSLGKEIFGEKYSIRILDYFGFECFKSNHLAQFFINCFNEQLHYHFVQRVFAWEVMDLMNEEVKHVRIGYFNNKDTLNELLGKPEGVLSIIDDASKKGHNGRYITANIHNMEKSKVMVNDVLQFSISHFTGTVSYNATDMPEKNRDFLAPEIIETMRNSQNPAIKMFFTNKLDKCGNLYIPLDSSKNKYDLKEKLSSNDQFSQTKKMRTQATVFRTICMDLLKELSVGSGSGGTHFIKCIRTDLKRKPLTMQKELVRQQVRALAVAETARARRYGYPHRMSFSEFLRRYKFLAFDFEENVEITRDNCRLLMVRLKMEGWALGKSKIFLKYYNEEYLSRLYQTQVKKIVKIQSILRRFLIKCRFAKEAKEQEKEFIQEIKDRRRNSIMTEDEAAGIIQKAYRKTNKRKEFSVFKQLEQDDCNFIKPFATKWKNKSMFSVLMRYRAFKLQDFLNFSQQVHFYNMNAFHSTQQIMKNAKLKAIDRKATVSVWLGEHINPVLKIAFRLNDIPFYDTSHRHDLLTNLGNFENAEPWDVVYQWRECRCKKTENKLQENLSISGDLINVTYTRNPDDEMAVLPKRVDQEVEDHDKQIKDVQNKSKKWNQTSDDENIETDDSMDTDVNGKNLNNRINTRKVRSGQGSGKIGNRFQEDRPSFEKYNMRKVDTSDNSKYIANSRPANKDFDYIKASPVSRKPKHPVDPIAELRNIARKDTNVSEDDPPFNFQGMLRKTNFKRDSMKNYEAVRNDSGRRDSLKNAFQAIRRFSMEKSLSGITNGNDAEDPILGKHIELELLPGLFMNGVEVDL